MRELFPEYYKLTEEEFKRLWTHCLFALDTNVLLDFYRYSEASRRDLLEVLNNPSICSRLWLPHHAALEYQKNKAGVISNQKRNLMKFESAAKKEIEALEEKIQSEANTFKKLLKKTQSK